jgi:hypothetical protein
MFIRLFYSLAIALVIGGALPANAQTYRRNYQREYQRDYQRNYDRQWNERYWRRYSKAQVARMIRNIETSANEFRSDLDRFLDRSRFDQTTREQRFNSIVAGFEQATNQLRAEFDRRDSWWETRQNVQQMLEAARPVDSMMRRQRMSRDVEYDWRRLRRHINRLASTYRLPQLVG